MDEEIQILIAGYDKVFLSEAEACAGRSQIGKERGNFVLEAGAAASAVSAACAAVESFVSERVAVYSTRNPPQGERIPPDLEEEIRKGRHTWSQLNGLVRHFGGEDFHLEPAYQDLEALVRLRGCIVHRSARYLTTAEWPHGIERKHRARIPHRKGSQLDWTARVFNAETAVWAAGTAEQILRTASRWVPEPQEGELIRVTVRLEDGLVIGDEAQEDVL